MNILFLAQIVPYPPDAGPKVKTWNILRYLASRGHRVSLAAFSRPGDEASLETLRAAFHRVALVPIRRNRLLEPWYYLKSFARGAPFLIERDDRADFMRVVSEMAAAETFDLIYADQITMAQFALKAARRSGARRPRLLFDAHNADWVVLERLAENSRFFLKPFLRREARLLKRYEGELVRDFDRTLAVSNIDRAALAEAYRYAAGAASGGEERILTIPITVDTTQIRPVKLNLTSKNILTLGTLHYPPNADGIRWFIHEVMPLVLAQEPGASLTIAGKNPPADFLELQAADPGHYRVPGYVPDLTGVLEEAGVMVVPVRAGGGMRVRILDAFARAVPAVTTTVGLEGIEAQPGRDILVEDDAAGFARAVVEVLRSPALREALARSGRTLAEERYDQGVALRQYDQILADLCGERQENNGDYTKRPLHSEAAR